VISSFSLWGGNALDFTICHFVLYADLPSNSFLPPAIHIPAAHSRQRSTGLEVSGEPSVRILQGDD
jgi:hypothetical protein